MIRAPKISCENAVLMHAALTEKPYGTAQFSPLTCVNVVGAQEDSTYSTDSHVEDRSLRDKG